MLTRRQYENLVVILVLALVVIAWAVSNTNIIVPTLPRIFPWEETNITMPVRTVEMPDVVARQMTALELQAAAPAVTGETVIFPDLIERQMMSLEAARAAAAVIPINPADLSADVTVGVPVLTQMAQEDLTLKASLSRDVVVGVPLLTETALADHARYAALSADYVVGLPILSARSQAEAARLLPAIVLPETAGTTQRHLFEHSLNWADFAPQTVTPVSDYAVGLPLLTEMAREEQARLAALSADYVVGVPVLTARAMAERARNQALSLDVRVDRPFTTQPGKAIVPMNQRIFDASRNWADFETAPAPRSAAAARIHLASLNWADFTPVGRTFETVQVVQWQGPQIRRASLNWADYLN